MANLILLLLLGLSIGNDGSSEGIEKMKELERYCTYNNNGDPGWQCNDGKTCLPLDQVCDTFKTQCPNDEGDELEGCKLSPSLWIAADINSIVNPPAPTPVIGWLVPFFAAVSLVLFFFGRNRLGLFATLFQNFLLSGSIIATTASSLFQVALQSSTSISELILQVIQSLWMLDPCFFIAPTIWVSTVFYLLLRKRRHPKSFGCGSYS